jgi:hypothetical protein
VDFAMSTSKTKSTPEELRELMQAEFVVPRLDVAGEQAMQESVADLPGIESVTFSGGKIEVCYDPLRVTAKDLQEAFGRSGHPAQEMEAERISPMAGGANTAQV